MDRSWIVKQSIYWSQSTVTIRKPDTRKRIHLKTRHFIDQISNGINIQKPDIFVQFSMGNASQMSKMYQKRSMDHYHSKTGPFGNQMHFNHTTILTIVWF